MPISRDLKPLYPADWADLAAEVKRRARYRCQHCGMRAGDRYYWRTRDGARIRVKLLRDEEPPGKARARQVQLGAAHLDHDPSHNDWENLAALCRYCHLVWDRDWHRQRRQLHIRQELAARPLMLGPTMEIT